MKQQIQLLLSTGILCLIAGIAVGRHSLPKVQELQEQNAKLNADVVTWNNLYRNARADKYVSSRRQMLILTNLPVSQVQMTGRYRAWDGNERLKLTVAIKVIVDDGLVTVSELD